MKLLNGEIYTAFVALGELSEKELPVKTSFNLAKLKIALAKLYEAIEKIRNDLVVKYGEADKEKPGTVKIEPNSENMVKFQEDYFKLMTEETEVEFEKVVLPLEVDGKPFEVSADVLMPLDKFIEIEG